MYDATDEMIYSIFPYQLGMYRIDISILNRRTTVECICILLNVYFLTFYLEIPLLSKPKKKENDHDVPHFLALQSCCNDFLKLSYDSSQ
jgi:hypothetical protein